MKPPRHAVLTSRSFGRCPIHPPPPSSRRASTRALRTSSAHDHHDPSRHRHFFVHGALHIFIGCTHPFPTSKATILANDLRLFFLTLSTARLRGGGGKGGQEETRLGGEGRGGSGEGDEFSFVPTLSWMHLETTHTHCTVRARTFTTHQRHAHICFVV